MSEKELTLAETSELAQHIQNIKIMIHCMDLDVLERSIQAFEKQISYQDTMIMFNPSYSPNKQNALKCQCEAMKHLKRFIDSLKEADKYKSLAENNPLDDIVRSFV